jgi:hypothetical protein
MLYYQAKVFFARTFVWVGTDALCGRPYKSILVKALLIKIMP